MYLTFIIKCEKITADHDGYCSGAENEETTEIVKKHIKVICSHKEFIYSIWAKQYNYLDKCGIYYHHSKDIDHWGSRYCDLSEKHKMGHQKLYKHFMMYYTYSHF